MGTVFSGKKTPVLDHGYIQLIESWGSDERIIESARMSTNKGFLGWGPSITSTCPNTACPGYSYSGPPPCLQITCPNCASELITSKSRDGDEKLLRYLYEHRHHTPFEMAGCTIEIQAPIFVFREWHRHRTQSYNEMSARYTPLPDLNYTPTIERLLINSKTNTQASTVKGASELNAATADSYL